MRGTYLYRETDCKESKWWRVECSPLCTSYPHLWPARAGAWAGQTGPDTKPGKDRSYNSDLKGRCRKILNRRYSSRLSAISRSCISSTKLLISHFILALCLDFRLGFVQGWHWLKNDFPKQIYLKIKSTLDFFLSLKFYIPKIWKSQPKTLKNLHKSAKLRLEFVGLKKYVEV